MREELLAVGEAEEGRESCCAQLPAHRLPHPRELHQLLRGAARLGPLALRPRPRQLHQPRHRPVRQVLRHTRRSAGAPARRGHLGLVLPGNRNTAKTLNQI